jgi:hypothetical protein
MHTPAPTNAISEQFGVGVPALLAAFVIVVSGSPPGSHYRLIDALHLSPEKCTAEPHEGRSMQWGVSGQSN